MMKVFIPPVLCHTTQNRAHEESTEPVLKNKSMIATDFHEVSVIAANYNKWLPIKNRICYASLVVSFAPCIYLSTQGKVMLAINWSLLDKWDQKKQAGASHAEISAHSPNRLEEGKIR